MMSIEFDGRTLFVFLYASSLYTLPFRLGENIKQTY